MPEHEQPEGAIVALKPCGCLIYVAADLPMFRADTALELARCVALGARPAYWTVEQVRAGEWSCPNCQRLATPVVALGADHDPLWAVSGFLTVTVRVELDGLVVRAADDNDEARQALITALNITTLAVDNEQITVEWDDDSITFTPAGLATEAATQVEQHALRFD